MLGNYLTLSRNSLLMTCTRRGAALKSSKLTNVHSHVCSQNAIVAFIVVHTGFFLSRSVLSRFSANGFAGQFLAFFICMNLAPPLTF